MFRRCATYYCVGSSCPRVVVTTTTPAALRVTLNNEKTLNALDLGMVEALLPTYRALVSDRHKTPQRVVVMKGAGTKAFCAGGDVVSIVKNAEYASKFFYYEYQLDNLIGTLAEPNLKVNGAPTAAHVALWDGIVMGGGFGISIHGSHRICTESTLFAMPETAIGFFPDVGGTYVLPRLPHTGLGLYLAMTGNRLKGADVVHAGLGTHFIAKDAVRPLEAALLALEDGANAASTVVEATQSVKLPEFTLNPVLPFIAEHFGPKQATVTAILDSLRAVAATNSADASAAKKFATSTLETLEKVSPSAAVAAFLMHRRGAKLPSREAAFALEFAAGQSVLRWGDFQRGVDALLISKTKVFNWIPPTVAELPADFEATLFATPIKTWDPVAPYPA